jgi:TolA-binding protein
MSKLANNINNNSNDQLRNRIRNGFEDNSFTDQEDSALFESIGDILTACTDLEDVKNDPAYQGTKTAVSEMMSDYKQNLSANRENENFIRDTCAGIRNEDKISDEVKFIKQEIDNKNLNLVTAEWVREWHERKQKAGIQDPKTEEIRSFITEAIDSQNTEQPEVISEAEKKPGRISIFARYIPLAAAAIAGIFLLLRALLPASDPKQIFDTYYTPLNAISPVTRSLNDVASANYSAAINSYKTGAYQEAVLGFGKVLDKEPGSEAAKFYMGLSQLALSNWTQTIALLTDISEQQGEFGKEARWYLGLACLHEGDKQKAVECFEYLAKSRGFYAERAGSILRRLK